MYGLGGTGDQLNLRLCSGWLVMAGMAVWLVNCAIFEPKKGEAALAEAGKVKRPVKSIPTSSESKP